MQKLKVSPSILSGDFANMQKCVELTEKWGADYIHCDVMDGVFVKNITFGMPMIKAIKKHTNLPLDVHLMIVSPEKYVDEFIKAGADIIVFHPDVCSDIRGTLRHIKKQGVKAGLAINPDIDVYSIKEYLDDIDTILLMSVFPGFGGQKFIDSVLEKIEITKKMIEGRKIEIEIDGGVNIENYKEIAKKGIDSFVAGSAVYKDKNPEEVIRLLQNALQ